MIVAAVQTEHGPEPLPGVLRALGAAADAGARLAVLPEYALMSGDKPGPTPEETLGPLRDLSQQRGLAVLAHAFEDTGRGLGAFALLLDDGRMVLRQQKVHPTRHEAAAGIQPGASLEPGTWEGRRVAIVVCADILHPATVARAGPVDLMLVPVWSRARFNDQTLHARRSLFIARAFDAGAVVIKAGGYTPDGRVAGRSLIAAPWGVVAEAPHPFRPALLSYDLSWDRLAAARSTFRDVRS